MYVKNINAITHPSRNSTTDFLQKTTGTVEYIPPNIHGKPYKNKYKRKK